MVQPAISSSLSQSQVRGFRDSIDSLHAPDTSKARWWILNYSIHASIAVPYQVDIDKAAAPLAASVACDEAMHVRRRVKWELPVRQEPNGHMDSKRTSEGRDRKSAKYTLSIRDSFAGLLLDFGQLVTFYVMRGVQATH